MIQLSHRLLKRKNLALRPSLGSIVYESNIYSNCQYDDGNNSSSRSSNNMRYFSSNEPADSDYAKQIAKMAETAHTKLTLAAYSDELTQNLKASTSGLNAWKTYMPGFSSQQAIKQINETKDLIDAVVKVLDESDDDRVGTEAGLDELQALTKKDKLKISLKSNGMPLSKINELTSTFESMEFLRRILNYRRDNDLPLPTNETQAKDMMKNDLKKVLTTKEVKEIQNKMRKANRI